ncbi:MAG: hypothetical protein U0804_16345 [Gemmataceae bacterium]
MTSPALFGILQLDRGEPFGYSQVPGLVQAWLQDAGGFAAVGLVLYLLYARSVPTQLSQSEKLRVPVTSWMLICGLMAAICYAGVFALMLLPGNRGAVPEPPPPPPGSAVILPPPVWHWQLQPMLLMVGGLFAIVGLGQPFVRDLLKLRSRRVWALSKLGFKEAVRSKLLWLGLLILPFFLFRNVWMATVRPSDEFRILVTASSFAITGLVLFTAALLAAFSIPNDIKNQTIHTVVTKPVERFEIVLGRFVGYTALMTLALAALTAFSLLMLNTATIDPKAEAETATARVPVRGALRFGSKKLDFEGTNVGREFEYRKYIAGDPLSPQRGIWEFGDVPGALPRAAKDAVRCEFTFDVFKLTKGEENKGVFATFRVVTHACPQLPPKDNSGEWEWADKDAYARYKADLDAVRKAGRNPEGAPPDTDGWKAANELAEKYGFYEIRNREAFDYAVGYVDIPAGLFRNAQQGNPPPVTDPTGKQVPGPRVSVQVKCESRGQLLGMAQPDLYLLEGSQPFTLNFIKGMVGLWCRLCIVVALAVVCSTYQSGVLSLLVTGLIFLTGYATEHLSDLAMNRNIGGGPFESISRLVKAETPTAPSSETAGGKALQFMDKGWAWVVRRIQNMIPDVESFVWTDFVSEGFNVNSEYLLVNLLVTAGYLLPWFVLGYFLMKSREVAN